MKHQTNCYRIIKGIRYINFCDLIMSDEENAATISRAKEVYSHVRKIKHPEGYYQLFVADLGINY